MSRSSELVEDLLHKHELLNRPRKMKMKNGEPLARYRWRLLYGAVKEAAGQALVEDRKDYYVSHGLRFLRRITHRDPVTQMLFIREKNLLFSIDREMIRTFDADGRRQDVIAMDGEWTHLVYASHVDQFVGWTPDRSHLILLKPDTFEFITASEAEDPVYQVLYNAETEEVLTSHEDYLQLWVFRYGNRHLLPRRKILLEFSGDNTTIDPPATSREPAVNILTLFAKEATRSKDQRLFAVCGSRGVKVFHMHQAQCIGHFRKLHRRQITAISFFNPMKLLATGSMDGSLKLWQTENPEQGLALYMVFVGHSAEIRCIDVYPFECSIMTVSADRTLRVWSLESADEVECCPLETDVLQLAVQADQETFYTLGSDHAIHLWQAYILARQHTQLLDFGREMRMFRGSTATDQDGVEAAQSGEDEDSATGVCTLVLTKEGLCHVVDAVTGSVVCSAVARDAASGDTGKVIAVDCSSMLDRIFALKEDGTLLKFSMSSNPCQLVEKVQPQIDASFVEATRMCVYEHRLPMRRPPTGQSLHPQSATYRDTRDKLESKTRVILFTAHRSGELKSFDLNQTRTRDQDLRGGHSWAQTVDAHDRKPLVAVLAHPSQSQLFSSGEDNVIRVWRVFPYTQEHLELLMAFYCSHKPVTMAAFKQNLVACFDDHASATYATVVYQLDDRNRHDHSPDVDHLDSIQGVSTCPRLRLFATSSLDGTVRIWNERNHLVRVLQFHGVADTMHFCSPQGDLLVMIHKTLHLVRHQHYLPKSYLRRLVMFGSARAEVAPAGCRPKPWNQVLLKQYSSSVQQTLTSVKPAFRYAQYSDTVAPEVLEELNKEKRAKQEALAKLAQRDEEIRKIRDGEVKAKTKRQSTALSRENAFHKYLEMFYQPVNASLPEDPYQEQRVQELLEGKQRRVVEPAYHAETGPGFFPPVSLQVKRTSVAPSVDPARGGYVPNSSLVSRLWPREVIKEKTENNRPTLTSTEISMLAKKYVEDTDASETARVFTWEDDDDEDTTMFIFDEDKPAVEKEPTEVEPENSDFMNRMKDILEKAPSPDESDLLEKELSSLEKSGAPTPITPMRTPSSSKLMKSLRQEELEAMSRMRSTPSRTPSTLGGKLLKKASSLEKEDTQLPASEPGESVFLTEVEEAPAPAPRTPSPPPPPPPPPIPEFVRWFREESWFQRLFPDGPESVTETLGQPLSPSGFAYQVALRMGELGWKEKKSLLQGLLTIHQREVLPYPIIVKLKNCQLQTLIHNSDQLDVTGDRSQRYFLESLFKFWASMDMRFSDVLVELLTWYFEVDDTFQGVIGDVLTYLGVQDPQGFLVTELDSWQLFEVREDHRKEDLRHVVKEWLEKWLHLWKISLQQQLQDQQQQQSQQANMKRPRAAGHGGRSGGHSSRSSHPSTEAVEKLASQASMSLVDEASSEYWDALAHFIATQLKKYEDMIRDKRLAARKTRFTDEQGDGLDEDGMKRNTVLVLPEIPPEKQFLVRLGESHADALKIRRGYQPTLGLLMEKDYSQPAALQPLRSYQQALAGGFAPYLHLPLKPCMVAPFHNALDEKEWHDTFEPEMVALRLSSKYFLPAFSCPPKPF